MLPFLSSIHSDTETEELHRLQSEAWDEQPLPDISIDSPILWCPFPGRYVARRNGGQASPYSVKDFTELI